MFNYYYVVSNALFFFATSQTFPINCSHNTVVPHCHETLLNTYCFPENLRMKLYQYPRFGLVRRAIDLQKGALAKAFLTHRRPDLNRIKDC